MSGRERDVLLDTASFTQEKQVQCDTSNTLTEIMNKRGVCLKGWKGLYNF